MINDNSIHVVREKLVPVLLNPGSGNASKQYFTYDYELENSVITAIRVFDKDINEFSATYEGYTVMAETQMDSYTVTFVDQDKNIIIDQMPLLNFFYHAPFSSVGFDGLPQFKLRFSPEKSYIATSDGSGLGSPQIIPFTFSYKRLM